MVPFLRLSLLHCLPYFQAVICRCLLLPGRWSAKKSVELLCLFGQWSLIVSVLVLLHLLFHMNVCVCVLFSFAINIHNILQTFSPSFMKNRFKKCKDLKMKRSQHIGQANSFSAFFYFDWTLSADWSVITHVRSNVYRLVFVSSPIKLSGLFKKKKKKCASKSCNNQDAW